VFVFSVTGSRTYIVAVEADKVCVVDGYGEKWT